MNKEALDRFLTSEPSQIHYDRWLDEVMSYISEEDISTDDFNNNFDDFIEPLLIKLSTSGTLPHGFVSAEFAAHVVKHRFWTKKKKEEFMGYLQRKKDFFEQHINWWYQII